MRATSISQASEVAGKQSLHNKSPETSEVCRARMRVGEDEVGGVDLQRKEERILLDKLGQMQPGMPTCWSSIPGRSWPVPSTWAG